jgi:hypothetical protein
MAKTGTSELFVETVNLFLRRDHRALGGEVAVEEVGDLTIYVAGIDAEVPIMGGYRLGAYRAAFARGGMLVADVGMRAGVVIGVAEDDLIETVRAADGPVLAEGRA